MNIEFLARFSKDLDSLNVPHLRKAIAKAIIEVENARNLMEVRNIKKLQGSKIAYRIRVGDYRIGFYYQNEIVQFARVVHRKDIYKVFP